MPPDSVLGVGVRSLGRLDRRRLLRQTNSSNCDLCQWNYPLVSVPPSPLSPKAERRPVFGRYVLNATVPPKVYPASQAPVRRWLIFLRPRGYEPNELWNPELENRSEIQHRDLHRRVAVLCARVVLGQAERPHQSCGGSRQFWEH